MLRTTHFLFHKSMSTQLQYRMPKSNHQPKEWQMALQRLPPHLYLPLDLGGLSENKHKAWYGDRKINLEIANAIKNIFEESLDRGVASKISATAQSNAFFAKHLNIILPYNAEELKSRSVREKGTALEAAVARVSCNVAVKDLADWLVIQALRERRFPNVGFVEYESY
mmetsp:Transcript_22816/g.46924  ORF Transcript_22816/g.46924 Transcript_22816/m.46924 type:complete len:168 (+) Transcript_22816:344-847(+)